MNKFYYATMKTPHTENYIKKNGITADLFDDERVPLATDEQTAADFLSLDCSSKGIAPDEIYALIFTLAIPDDADIAEGQVPDAPIPLTVYGFKGNIPPDYITNTKYVILKFAMEQGGGSDGTTA